MTRIERGLTESRAASSPDRTDAVHGVEVLISFSSPGEDVPDPEQVAPRSSRVASGSAVPILVSALAELAAARFELLTGGHNCCYTDAGAFRAFARDSC
jgi:hypothetical protein